MIMVSVIRRLLLRYIFFALLGMGLIIPTANARPVSYPGGWTTMLMNDGDKNTAHVHFSPSVKYSIGYKFEYWRDREFTLHAIQVNSLVKRWNKKHSQANFYLKAGIGMAETKLDTIDSSSEAAGFIGIATDWEDRRYFVSYQNRYTKAGKLADFYQQSARVGWAPYVGDYGDLHTWLMLQVDHMPEAENNLTITPLVRLFKGVHMLEAGMNNRGEILFNYILRY